FFECIACTHVPIQRPVQFRFARGCDKRAESCRVSFLGHRRRQSAVRATEHGECNEKRSDHAEAEVLTMRRMRVSIQTRLLPYLLIAALAANGQQIGRNNTSQEPSTFKVSTQLVVETVVVKDKDGNSVDGLKASDFTVTENGQPQTIKFFE